MLFSDKASALAHAQLIFKKGVPDAVLARIAGGAALNADAFLNENMKEVESLRSLREEANTFRVADTKLPKALADNLKKEEDNLVSRLVAAVSQGMRYTQWAGVAELREELQQVAASIREVVLSEISDGNQRAVLNKVFGKAIGALFGNTLIEDAVPSLAEANELITLIASMLAQADSPLQGLTFPADQVAANVPFFQVLVTEFFTHSAKHAHSSASFWASFEVKPSGTGQLNGHELGESLLGASTGGGKLRDATWLLSLLTTNLAAPGAPAIRVFDCLTAQAARDQLIAQGLTAVGLLPYCGASLGGEFNGHLVPVIRFAVPGEAEGVALAVVPSNGMLKAMVELRDTIWAQRSARRESLILKQADQIRELLQVDAPELENLVQAYHAENSPQKRDKAREALAKLLKKLKPADRTSDAWAENVQAAVRASLAAVRSGARIANIGIVGSQPQNVSNVYKELAGTRGVPRFPAYRKAPLADSPLVRAFFASPAMLRKRLTREVARAPVLTLATYKVGTKWLPNRVQAAMQASRVEQAANRFMKVLRDLAYYFKSLSEEERTTCAAGARGALERYILAKDVSPEVLAELSQEALVLVPGASKADREAILETVTQRLKGA